MAVSDKGILKMSENHVIATLLPGTTFFLGKKNYAPFKKLKDAGIDIALATDYNPGSCQIQSMPFILTLSCIYMKMTVFEAIKASTHTAARSLLLQDKVGSLEPGKNADIIIWDIEKAIQIPYMASQNHIGSVLKNGEVIFTA
jgi:imidazolonepropionase